MQDACKMPDARCKMLARCKMPDEAQHGGSSFGDHRRLRKAGASRTPKTFIPSRSPRFSAIPGARYAQKRRASRAKPSIPQWFPVISAKSGARNTQKKARFARQNLHFLRFSNVFLPQITFSLQKSGALRAPTTSIFLRFYKVFRKIMVKKGSKKVYSVRRNVDFPKVLHGF